MKPGFVPGQNKIPPPRKTERRGTFVPESDWFGKPMRDPSTRADTEIEGGKIYEVVMLSWVVTFLIIALIAGILGFGGIAGASIEIAKVIFFIAVVLFLVSAVIGLARGRTRV
jgi:uncharacterized membrane protein YtjA (UPF0391 family)